MKGTRENTIRHRTGDGKLLGGHNRSRPKDDLGFENKRKRVLRGHARTILCQEPGTKKEETVPDPRPTIRAACCDEKEVVFIFLEK